ncbi:MAG: Hsp20/alpha crystallin family protein, partial [Deltaproteobacteria bacterium]|nr:Hsp20/alpha crystallin family protein [Deltaproteobacteria bacterium]
TEIDRLWREMDHLMSTIGEQVRRKPTAGVFPLVNITEDQNNYYVRTELPGMKPGDITISVTGNNLSICGERKIGPESDNVRYHRRERESGAFRRAMTFSSDIDGQKVEALCKNGILTIILPKAEEAKPRQILVKGE